MYVHVLTVRVYLAVWDCVCVCVCIKFYDNTQQFRNECGLAEC